MADGEHLKIKVGQRIRHHKRGSEYDVIAEAWAYEPWKKVKDNAEFFVCHGDADQGDLELLSKTEFKKIYVNDPDALLLLKLPVLVQVSERDVICRRFMIYSGSGMFFARPHREFTSDRFEVIA